MGDQMQGSIQIFGGNFAPRDWAFCEGQLMPISENQALFAILGNNWGGDGRTNFAAPDYRGRVPIGNGRGPGLTEVYQTQKLGIETYDLRVENLPAHSHAADFHPTGGGGGSGSSSCAGSLNVATNGTDASTASSGSHLSAGPIKAGNFGVGNLYKDGASSFTSLEVDVKCSGGGGGGITGGTVAIGDTGGDKAISLMQPNLGTIFILALQGIFPSRN